MGMSPSQDPPKFHLISVPLIQCKPPHTFTAFPREINQISEPTESHWITGFPIVINDRNCHSSFPFIPQECFEHAQAVFTPQGKPETFAQYFHTIPFNASAQRIFNSADTRKIAYKDEPPHHRMHNKIMNSVGPICNLNDSKIYYGVEDSHQVVNTHHLSNNDYNTGARLQNENAMHSNGTCPNPHSSNAANVISTTKANCVNNGGTVQDSARDSEHWMEQHLNQLWIKRLILLKSLEEAEALLNKLICEEMVLTGNWTIPNMFEPQTKNARSSSRASLTDTPGQITRGLQDAEGRVSGLISRLKWRHSRRSKSAHERVPVDLHQIANNAAIIPRSHQNNQCSVIDAERNDHLESNGAITVVHDNEERVDATVPRRLLRWWRQNKRRSMIDEKRRQSMGFMSMHCPDSGSSLPPMKLRTRGSSMPPNENRTNKAEEGETFRRSFNQASLRLNMSHVNGPNARQSRYALNNNELMSDCSAQPVNIVPSNTGRQSSQTYQLFHLLNRNSANVNPNLCYIEDLRQSCNQKIQLIPCGQQINPSSSAMPDSSDSSAPYINQGDVATHYCPLSKPESLSSEDQNNLNITSARNTRWTTVRCRPLCPIATSNENHPSSTATSSTPPPLPPRITACGLRTGSSYSNVMASARHQVQHPKIRQEWNVPQFNVRHLSDGTQMGILQQNHQQPRSSVCNIMASEDALATTVQSASHFEPINFKQACDRHQNDSNAPQIIFHPIPNLHVNSGFPRVCLTSMGNTARSRIFNGYETCPQTNALATQRFQSAKVASYKRHQGPSGSINYPADEIWHIRRSSGQVQTFTDPIGHSDDEHVFRTKVNTTAAQRFYAKGFEKQNNELNGHHPAQISGLLNHRQGVSTLDECNAALRECLRGWELKENKSAAAKPRPNLPNDSTGTNFRRNIILPEFSDSTKNVQWTRLGNGLSHISRNSEFSDQHARSSRLNAQEWYSNNTRQKL